MLANIFQFRAHRSWLSHSLEDTENPGVSPSSPGMGHFVTMRATALQGGRSAPIRTRVAAERRAHGGRAAEEVELTAERRSLQLCGEMAWGFPISQFL